MGGRHVSVREALIFAKIKPLRVCLHAPVSLVPTDNNCTRMPSFSPSFVCTFSACMPAFKDR